MARTFSWIHISDLHFRATDEYERGKILTSLLEDIQKRIRGEEDFRPDALFLTGDIANSGRAEEYALAGPYIKTLAAAAGLSLKSVFCVPGNHDLAWKSGEPSAPPAGLEDRKSLSALIGDPAAVQARLARRRNYTEFRQHMFPWQGDNTPSGLAYAASLPVNGLQVSVVGLDSAWLSGLQVGKGSLLVGERQVREALAAAPTNDLLVALVHHPPSFLKEFDELDVRNVLEQNCDFVLHGHVHTESAVSVASPDSAMYYLAAGAVYEPERELLAYNAVRLDLEQGLAQVWLRAYSDRLAGWVPAAQIYRAAPDGRFQFRLPARLVRKSLELESGETLRSYGPPALKSVAPSRDGGSALSPLLVSRDARLPIPEPPVPEAPYNLLEAIRARRCVLFAGAGASADAKLPTWYQLVADMVDQLDKAVVLPPGEKAELQGLLEQKELIVLAHYCMDHLTRYEFGQFLRKRLEDTSPSPTHEVLAKIAFRAALTTNFDPYIENTHPRAQVILPDAMDRLRGPGAEELLQDERKFPVIKIHGSYDDVDSLVLNDEDFRTLIFQKPGYQEFMRRILSGRPLFFYGYSFNDPNLDFALQQVISFYDGSTPPHYALLPDPGRIKSDFLLQKYNIRVIPYTVQKNPDIPGSSHIAAFRFLEKLALVG